MKEMEKEKKENKLLIETPFKITEDNDNYIFSIDLSKCEAKLIL